MPVPRALLLACALLALGASARRSCNTARYGLQQGREVHIQDQRMAAYAPDWKIIVPPVCERIVGVTATACDADGAPNVYMSSLTHGLVIRDGEINTGAYLYVTVFCDPNELNPELLELLPNRTPSMLRLPPSRFRVVPGSTKLPWLMGSRPVTSISPEHLIMLNFPRWPNAHEPDWPEQPVILDVKSFLVPSTYAAPTVGTFPQAAHAPLRRPRLLLSRSPTTEFPGARWAGQAPNPQPEHDLVSDQEEPIATSDVPEHDQSQELATAASIEPDHDKEQAAPLNAESEHDGDHADKSVEQPEHDEAHAMPAAGESDSSENNVMPMSGQPNSDDESVSNGENHHRFRPLTLVRQIAQWWTKHVHGALRGRRMPRRRVGYGDPLRPGMLRSGALNPGVMRLEHIRSGVERSDARRRTPLYYWRD